MDKENDSKERESRNYYKIIAFSCLVIVLILSILAMLAWLFDLPILASISLSYIPMAPLTALLFFLAGLTLIIFLEAPSNKISKTLSWSILAIFSALILIKIIEFVSGLRFGLEEIFVRNPEKLGAVLKARISPITAANFLFLGFAIFFQLIASSKRRVNDIAGTLSLVVFLTSIVLLLGYLYNAPFLYGGTIIPVALTTSLAFFFLSLAAILTLGPDCFPLNMFTGGSARAILLRSFLPIIVIVTLVHELFVRLIESFINISLPLQVAIEAILVALITGIIVFRVSEVIGGRIDTANMRQKKAQERLRYLAYHDVLTDLPDRRLFYEMFHESLKSAEDRNQVLAMFFLDLENYKEIKNTIGHKLSDKMLLKITKELASIRPGKMAISRIGEEEFLAYSIISDVGEASDLAKKIITIFRKPIAVGEQILNVFANLGVAVYPEDGEDADSLINNADVAMVSAKNLGSNNYQFFEKSMEVIREKSREKLRLSCSINAAIINREFVLYYQPIFNIAKNEIEGAEALVRWQKPKEGLIMPDAFIPLSENSGQILAIGDTILHEYCPQNRIWHKERFHPLKLSMNLSAKQFLYFDLVKKISTCITGGGLAPNRIILEVTESVVMMNPELSIQIMRELKGIGVKISIDDFGTGYSSLSYLKELPVDILKIHQSFIRDIDFNHFDQAIVRAVIELAHGLGIEVTAEGVENEKQLAYFKETGCDFAQGYLFSKPLPAKEFEEKFLRKKRAA